MDSPLVSIIVPVYNSARYLERCLDSIIGQTYSKLEIILIDDGSDDDSLMILRKYERSDSRIKVLENGGVNKGQSAARNAGLRAASGEWIIFIDSDDEVTADMTVHLLSTAQENNAQICVGSYIIYNDVNNNGRLRSFDTKVMSGREAYSYLVCDKNFMIVCVCIFKKELFDGLMFPEGKIYEDSFMFVHVLPKADICVCTDRVIYHYYQRKNGAALSRAVEKSPDRIWVLREIGEFTEAYIPERAGKIYHFIFYTCGEILEHIYSAGNDKYKKYWTDASEYYLESSRKLSQFGKLTAREKLEVRFFSVSPAVMINYRRLTIILMRMSWRFTKWLKDKTKRKDKNKD